MEEQSYGSAASGPAPLFRADWYPDPTRRFEYRYHNGWAWTGDVSVDGNRFIDALPSASPSGVDAPPPVGWPTQQPGWQPPPPRPAGSGRAVAAFILALSAIVVGWVPFLCVLAIAAVVLAVIFGIGVVLRDRRLRASGQATPSGRGFATVALVLAPFGLAVSAIGVWLTVVVYREIDEFTYVGVHAVDTGRCGVDDGRAHFDGTITNASDSTRTYRIEVEFVRPGTDNVLHSVTAHARNVAPGDTENWQASVFATESELDCRVAIVTGPLPFTDD